MNSMGAAISPVIAGHWGTTASSYNSSRAAILAAVYISSKGGT